MNSILNSTFPVLFLIYLEIFFGSNKIITLEQPEETIEII